VTNFRIQLTPNPNDSEPCRLRNAGGSENGTCSCHCVNDCPNPPAKTAVELMLASVLEQLEAKLDAQDSE
jgi:hypothetical protein